MANRTLMGENSFYRRVKSPAICQPLQVVEVGGHVRVVEEVDMFARQVSFQLKSNMLPDYTRTFESEILPLLRKQKGFEDEITLSNPGSLDAIAISLWENKANAEAYDTNTYPEVLKTLAKVIDGTPKVQTFEAVTTTIHHVAVGAPPPRGTRVC
jgi:hypothetical protein